MKQIAREVPSASQVYSSLGMVYEDMLRESRRKQPLLTSENAVSGAEAGGTVADEDVPDKMLAEQLDLARKAYGAYHVAAILWYVDSCVFVRLLCASRFDVLELHTAADETHARYHKTNTSRSIPVVILSIIVFY